MAESTILKEEFRSLLREHPEVLAEEFPRILKDHPDVLEKPLLSILPKMIVDHMDLVIKRLPEAIERRPEIKGELYVVLSKEYVTKEEIKAILERIDALREDFNRHREDSNRRFEALIQEIRDAEKRLEIRIGVLGSRWGDFAEETLRNTLKRLLSERFKVTKIEKWETEDEEGYVFNIPQKIEVDFLLKDDIDYLIEISASANERDVASFFRKGELYKRKTNKTPKLLFIAVNMHKKGKILCEKLGIELITYDELIEEKR